MENARTKNNFTPGPWHCGTFRETGNAPGIDIGAANNSNIALAHHDSSDRESYETKANARLIAAAPDLLEALNDIVGGTLPDDTGRLKAIREVARAAIAKATGDA